MAPRKKIEKAPLVEDQAEENRDSVAMKPATKSAAIAGMVSLMSGMPKDQVINRFYEMMQMMNSKVQASGIPDDAAQRNQASVAMKGAVSEDIQEIFGGEELTEEFREKITTLFEAAVESRVSIELQNLAETFEESVEEKVESIREELIEQIDQYLNYFCEEWMKENEVAIESALKVEIAEDFMGGLKNLFLENYIEVPENKVDIVEELYNKLQETEEKMNELINDNIEMAEELADSRKLATIAESCEGMSITEQQKFISLVENIDYDEKFDSKIKVIREQLVEKKRATRDTGILTESFEGNSPTKKVNIDPTVNRYAEALKRNSKN